jgi:nucleoside-diphosphate-sugar epimerase
MSCPACFGEDPFSGLPRWRVSHVLSMAALELCHPLLLVVLLKSYDTPLRHPRCSVPASQDPRPTMIRFLKVLSLIGDHESMKVFLTGATGYIGTAVAERLLAAGHELTALARSESSLNKLRAAGISPLRGDFAEPTTVGRAATAADGVISLATTYDAAIDGPAIDAILGALDGSNKPFIYTSGIWSHGDTGGRVVDETAPAKPAELVAWRQAVEERVLASARRGIRSIVIRPAIVYGRGAGIPATFVESARKEGAARFIGTGKNRWPLVHVDDLADLYLLALENAPPGTLLLGVAGPSRAVSEMAAAASRGAGAGGRTVATPLEEARKSMGAYADALALDQQATGKRAQELLGWKPHRPDILQELERGSYVDAGARV